MKEKLIIKNFGPIKSVDLDLGKITVLIGEQATGKSTIAKVLSICRFFSYIVDDSESATNYKSSFSNTALLDWGLSGYEIETSSYIFYKNEDYSVEIKHHPNHDIERTEPDGETLTDPVPPLFLPSISPISEKFKNLLEEYKRLKPSKEFFGISSDWTIPHSFLTTDVKKVMKNPFYFPTERGLQSIFSIGKRGLENLNDRLYEQLAALNGLSANFKNDVKIDPLDIHYKYENGQAKFKGLRDNAYYNLSQGASGYQSTIPIILAVKYYNEIENRKRTWIIEEPELNLFPKAQKKLIEFLVESVNSFDNQFILPTHSPYILTSLENLMYAYKLGNSCKGKFKKQVESIVDEKYWINQDDVSAYYLGEENEIDLMIREEALINKEYIDSVSDSINRDFDNLLEIELLIEKEMSE